MARERADESAFGILAFAPQTAFHIRIFPRIHAVLAHELLRHQVHQPLIPVATSQMDIPVGGQSREIASPNLHHRDIKRAAAQVIDQDVAAFPASTIIRQEALLKPERHRRGRRFVDDVQDFEARDVSGVLGRFAANFIEVGRYRDDHLLVSADLLLRIQSQLVQDPSL